MTVPGHDDDELLRQLRSARETSPQDFRRQASIEAQLLARYDAWLRRIAESKVGSDAADEVVNRTLESIAKRLQGDLDFPKALWRIALDSLDGDVKDHWRAWYRQRKREPVSLNHGATVPEAAAEELTLATEAVELRERLLGSSDADIQLLGLRLFAGLSPQQIADQLGKSRGAVDTALSRAVAKVRERETDDVRDSRREAER